MKAEGSALEGDNPVLVLSLLKTTESMNEDVMNLYTV